MHARVVAFLGMILIALAPVAAGRSASPERAGPALRTPIEAATTGRNAPARAYPRGHIRRGGGEAYRNVFRNAGF